MTTMFSVDGYKFHVRPDTLDEWIIKESFVSKVYLNKIQLTKQDRWLDVGAHIGSFSVSVAEHVDAVIAFEPEPENFALLESNIFLNRAINVFPWNTAIVGDDRHVVYLYKNLKKNTGSHSFFVQRGREQLQVPCLNINHILVESAIDKIKIDAEGAEYEILKGIKLWDKIKELIFEFDFQKLKDVDHSKYFEILQLLTSKGFEVRALQNPTKHWHTIVYAKRNI